MVNINLNSCQCVCDEATKAITQTADNTILKILLGYGLIIMVVIIVILGLIIFFRKLKPDDDEDNLGGNYY